MKWKVAIGDFFLYFIFLMGITLNLIDSTFKLVEMKHDIKIEILIVSLTIIYLWISTSFRFAAVLITIPIAIYRPAKIINFASYIINNFSEFKRIMLTNQYIPEEFTKYYVDFVYVAVVVSLIIIYYLVAVKKNSIVLLVIGSAIYLFYYFMGSGDIFKNCSIFLILMMILYAFNEYIKRRNKWSDEDVQIRKNYFYRWISLTIILVFVSSYIIQILKYDIKPVTFDWFEQNVLNRFDVLPWGEKSLSDTGLKSKFNLTYTGYQEDPGQLGGPIKEDNSIALRIYSKSDVTNLHLRGSVSDSYDGRKWNKTNNKTEKIDGNIKWDLEKSFKSENKNIRITSAKVVTTTAFNSLYPLYIKNSYNYVFIDSDMEIYHPAAIKRGNSYEVEFKEYDQAEVQKGISQLQYNASDKNYGSELEKYLKLPELPSRVFALTKSITQEYKTPLEKASAIENYLKSNFPYSKETTVLPKERDFVDYFLFDEKKGYCTYYATAMAVMARIIGIPSRYVEGYAFESTFRAGKEVNILNTDAHSWVELYFDGVGWVTFDPTPGMNSLALDLKEKNQTGGTNPGNTNPSSNGGRVTPGRPELENLQDIPEGDSGVNNISPKSINLLNAACTALGILILGIVILVWNINSLKRRDYLYYSFQKIIIYGKYLGVEYKIGETINEYLKRLGKEMGSDLGEYVMVYESILYGGENFNSKAHKKLTKALHKIRSKIVKNNGRLKFMLFDTLKTMMLPFKKTRIIN